jgi:hypothetical protein
MTTTVAESRTLKKLRCKATRNDGKECGHVVATILVDEWPDQRRLGTRIECRRCGAVEKLAHFM